MSSVPTFPGQNGSAANALLAEIPALESFLHNLAEGVVLADRGGKLLFCNRVARSILGFDSDGRPPEKCSDLTGCYRPDRITPLPPHELPLAQALAGVYVPETEIFVRASKGDSGIWIAAEGTPLRNPSGEIWGAVLLIRDVTARKAADQRIRMLTSAVEQTADSIVVTDRDGVVEYVNPAFELTTGYTRAEVVGRTPRILKSGIHDRAFYEGLWATISAGGVFRGTIANRRKSGEIYYAEQTITPMRDFAGNITHFVSVIKDITEQRKLREQEFQMSLARAVQQHLYSVPPPRIEGFDIAGAAFPADATGGDYFDFLPLPGGHLGIFIGDVSGHSISSALLMVELRACLRAYARKLSNLGEILALVNNILVSDLEGNRYATVAFCRLHPSSRRFVYASAGHPAGYVLDASGRVKKVLDSTDVPLGLFRKPAFAFSPKIKLHPGDVLTFLTDGILEAHGPDGVEFGAERALDVIRAHRCESAQQIVTSLYEAVRAYAHGLPQTDDITVVICKSL